METISEWVLAQKFLYDHCVSSIVFDYSGHGDSTRPGTIGHLNEDAIPAYATFVSQFPGERLCVLGHSMGNAPLLESLPRFSPPPSCVVVANAFSSLRDAGRKRGTSIFLLYAIPDAWDDVENAKLVRVPLLVVYSDADTVNPPDMGQQHFRSCAGTEATGGSSRLSAQRSLSRSKRRMVGAGTSISSGSMNGVVSLWLLPFLPSAF